MGKLEDKVAIITGAGSGFGRATSILFSKEGAKVVVADIVEKSGKETVDLIKANGGEAIFVKVDVSKSADCENMVKVAVESYGKLDILFNNAGIQGEGEHDIAHMKEEVFDRFMNVNLKGVWLGIHYAAAELVKTKGAIINTASYVGSVGALGCSHYATSKGAVKTLTFVAANELGLHGVRCNCISPYMAETPGTAFHPKKYVEMEKSGNPMHKLIPINDVADAVLFLATNSSVNGHDLYVDAGANTLTNPTFIDVFKEANQY
jgi:NAD(P)-dependent dehydrogenase (short-subunit alcohol dehydrogenase family)